MANYIYTNNGLVNSDELKHYGVLGMKWGVRKDRSSGFVPKKPKGKQQPYEHQKSERQKRYEDDYGINPHRPNGTKTKDDAVTRRVKEYYRKQKRSRYAGASTDGSKKSAAEKARQDLISSKRNRDNQYKAKKKAYKAAKRMANVEAKAVKQKYREQYRNGSSAAGRVYAKLTDADRYYADMMYDINNGAYIDDGTIKKRR